MRRWEPVTLKRGVTRYDDGEALRGSTWVRKAERLIELGLARRRKPTWDELTRRRAHEQRNKERA